MSTYIIAEIGINHNGSLETAKKLIDIAAVAGCDAVKFQKRNPDVCVPEHQKSIPRETPWGTMSYLEYKYRMEFGQEEYDIIDVYCKEKNIDEETAVKIWQNFEYFSGYGFNKSHAVYYSILSFQCAWLLNYYPECWTAAFLDKEPESRKEAAINLAQKHGFKVENININTSSAQW